MIMPKSPEWFFTLLATQLANYKPESTDPKFRVPNLLPSQLNDSYDFIIVGAGTSGSVVANRLSEESDWSILVLEDGQEENHVSDTPILTRDNWFTAMDWNLTTTPQKRACLAFDGGRCFLPRGRLVGGTSAINLMMYVRGNKQDYDNWESKGNVGWGYQQVKKYFLKSEDMGEEELRGAHHGAGGPLRVEYPPHSTPLREAYMQAGRELGYQHNDYNGRTQTGISYPQFTMKHGMRMSTAKAYLRPLRDRPNVHVAKGVLVTKILFDKDKKIEGVTFELNGSYTIKANKEVILAAGVYHSPKLLMLSGIGPKEHLSKLNIPVLVDSMTGDYLQDQISVPVYYKVTKSAPLVKSKFETKEAIEMFAKEGKGPLSSPVGIEALGFFNLKNRSAVPDVQMVVMSYLPSEEPLIVLTTNKLRPRSRGTVRLRSADPRDPLLIDPQYFAEESDYRDTVEACLLAMRFAETKALSGFSPRLDTSWTPKCAGEKDKTALCTCLTENYSNSMYNAVGSALMAHPREAARSVVCPRLRVHGVKGLRLIDSSVMPVITSGDTYAPTIMIAEMGSDLIKNQWKSK